MMARTNPHATRTAREPFVLLVLGALGVVYGDIGTSPLYALNETFFGNGHLPLVPAHIVGAASLIVWLLILVVGIKYAVFVLRADSDGEGGVFALMSLLERIKAKRLPILTLLLMFSAGLLFGEGIITPAISVLSAVEGLKVLLPVLADAVVPLTIVILTGIFALQSRGTRTVSKLYGPIMFAWFVTIAAIGLTHLLRMPELIPQILDPRSALTLLTSLDLKHAALVLGSVFLVLTGSEALYADLGHFGKRAIRVGWVSIVFPALALSYAGQAAYLASGAPVIGGNLFYSLVPSHFLVPMILLATLATSIASVALIFGAYSVVSQAIVLNVLPRLRVIHTNATTEGQIYIPAINWLLYAGTISLVLGFKSASNLAAAYGFAVSGVMTVTTIAMYELARRHWGWRRVPAALLFGLLACVDLTFVGANSLKFFEGGYIPLALGVIIFTIILTWRWGRKVVHDACEPYVATRDMAWLLDFKRRLREAGGRLCDDGRRCAVMIERTVIFLVPHPIRTPSTKVPVKLRIYLKRRGAMPAHMMLLNITQHHVPYVREHYFVVDLGEGVVSVSATFGFMEDPDASKVIRELHARGLFPSGNLRCTIEASEDEIIIANDLPWLTQLRAKFYRVLLTLSAPRYRYLGFSGEASAGLSKTVVPVRLSQRGARVEIPEFPLRADVANLDPDTNEPSTTPYSAIP